MRLYLIFLCTLVVIFLTFNFSNFSRAIYETSAGTASNSKTPFNTTTNSETPSSTPSNTKNPSNTTTNSKTPSSTPSNSETPSSTPSNSKTPSNTTTNSETPSNSKTPSSSITNSETPSPSNETEILPTGVVYLIHLPKTGGSYLKDVIDSMVEEDKSVDQIQWERTGKTLENITGILEDLEEADYYDQIHFFQHHHRYPSVVDIVPVLLDYKKRSEEKGFIFDIILASMRDPLDLSLSQYNYGRQNGREDIDFPEFMQKKPSPLTDSIIFPTPVIYHDHPWEETGNKTVEEILQPIFDTLSNIDYVLFSETLDDKMQLYFECKLNRKYVTISPVNVSKKFLYKEDLDLDLIEEFYQVHAIDQYLYSKSHSLFFSKDIC